MARIKIRCPKCNRTLGDTAQSLDAVINCHKCGAQRISLKITTFADYIADNNDQKEAK